MNFTHKCSKTHYFSLVNPYLSLNPSIIPDPVHDVLFTGDVQADVERGTRTLVKSRDDDYDDDDDVEEVKL